MKRPRARVIAAIVLGVPVVLASVLLVQYWIEQASKPVLPPPPPLHEPRLVVEPAALDLGRRSQCDGLIRVRGTVRNASSEPAILDDWVGSCGCTVPFGELRRGMTIAPGQSLDFEVTSDSWATTGPKTYTVDFIERSALRPARLTLTYVVESPLSTNMGHLLRSTDPTSELLVRSKDKKPFRILSVDPPVASFDSERAEAEQRLDISWSKVDERFGPDWFEGELLIRTDRSDCPVVHFRLQGAGEKPPAPAPSGTTPGAPAAR